MSKNRKSRRKSAASDSKQKGGRKKSRRTDDHFGERADRDDPLSFLKSDSRGRNEDQQDRDQNFGPRKKSQGKKKVGGPSFRDRLMQAAGLAPKTSNAAAAIRVKKPEAVAGISSGSRTVPRGESSGDDSRDVRSKFRKNSNEQNHDRGSQNPGHNRRRDDAGYQEPEPKVRGRGPVEYQQVLTFVPPGAGSKSTTPPTSTKPTSTSSVKPFPTSKPAPSQTRAHEKVQGLNQSTKVRREEKRDVRRDDRRGDKRNTKRNDKRNEKSDPLMPWNQAKQPDERVNDSFVIGKASGSKARLATGLIKRHPDGFGFLLPDDDAIKDVYIPKHHMIGIMTNDRVLVEVYDSRDRDRYFGEILEVQSRAVKRVVGRYLPVDVKYGIIQDDGKGWGADLRIRSEDAMNAQEGDLIAAEILSYPGRDQEFQGRVIEIIGDIEDPLNDVRRVIHSAHIPNEFSAPALAEARRYGAHVSESDMRERKDLRELGLITIDGTTARDFDDAVYVEARGDGFRLWVAIADVSHYVKPGTKLDEEAFERGTSTYFPNFVVPMLPEELSNELCSLKPNVPRLGFVCEMQISFEGELQSFEFYEAVIKSQARVTYGEAQEVIDGETPSKLQHVRENILRAADLAKILMQKRFREGSLDLEIPETQVVVDASGETSDIIRSERLFAHRLIEELMLVTNIATAKFITNAEIPGIFRIHDAPNADNLAALDRYMQNFGSDRSIAGSGQNLAKRLTKALQGFAGKPEAQILNILTLRTMQQAKYSPNNVGHFGLGFDQYSHFTSPIRRYPDLIAHRLIKSVLYPKYRGWGMSESDLLTATTMLSACEQRSVKAERQLISIKKARFISRFLGQEFEGVISSVTKFGVFVLLRTYDVDGLIKVEELGKDRFIFDDENLRLYGKRSGLTYKIGDKIQVQIAKIDAEVGRIEFVLSEAAKEALGENAGLGERGGVMGDESGSRGRRGGRGEREERGSGRDREERGGGRGKKKSKFSGKDKKSAKSRDAQAGGASASGGSANGGSASGAAGGKKSKFKSKSKRR